MDQRMGYVYGKEKVGSRCQAFNLLTQYRTLYEERILGLKKLNRICRGEI